ncbi:hypothetical protein HZA33_01350 [Candidatus Pacearchaeota archaeon]|nr:hypothetical protein [Candidatus Pacearchaeota archaeon]
MVEPTQKRKEMEEYYKFLGEISFRMSEKEREVGNDLARTFIESYRDLVFEMDKEKRKLKVEETLDKRKQYRDNFLFMVLKYSSAHEYARYIKYLKETDRISVKSIRGELVGA